jgi:hypothetical protein
MFEGNVLADHSIGEPSALPRVRLVRDSLRNRKLPSLALNEGEMYRIAYSIKGSGDRVSRSVALYLGSSEKRSWGGEVLPCLDFELPQGRKMSLLAEQVIDARAATLGEHGKWVLVDDGRGRGRRRVGSR